MITIKGVKYMSDFEAKKAIIDVGKRMYDKNFVASNDGNISCKVGPDALWTTCTGVSKGFMTPEMLVKINLDGKVLQGKAKPSSEVKMHLRVYKENPDVQAVTHAHPPIATSFAIAGVSLDKAILPEAVVQLGTVPVASYATPGSQQVPDSIAPYVNEYNGVLLANHGALTWGSDLYQAYYRLESLEYYAKVLMFTGHIICKQNELSPTQINALIDIRNKLGISTGGMPVTSVTDDVPAMNISAPPQQIQSSPAVDVSGLKGVTQIVRPTDTNQTTNTQKSKTEIIDEVVRRVVQQIK